MTIIDGIGDEVTYFFIAVAVIIIATIAWITTDIQQGLYVRTTVYLLEHSRINQTRIRLSNHTESATISEGIQVEPVEGDTQQQEAIAANDVDDESSRNSSNELLSPIIEVEEEGPADIIQAMDAPEDGDAATLLRRRRLEHFQNRSVNGDNTNAEVPPVELEEQHVEYTSTGTATSTSTSESTPESNITIKLKYINDDMKIVDGRLEEKLGDFKQRHFNVELASNKLVRLIFNGQVLQGDAQTLESYGMFDNCVVHCLVHQPRTPNAGDNTTHADNGMNRNGIHMNNNATTRDWDLGNLLLMTLTFTLGSAWYFRFQYPQLFTISTSVGLIALSGMFLVVVVSIYLPHILARRVRIAVTSRDPPPTNNTNRT